MDGFRDGIVKDLKIFGRNEDALPRDRFTLWLDCNSDFYGTYENLQAQARGEIVRPVLE